MIHHLIHTEIQIWTETGHFYLRRMKINNSDGLLNKNWAQICSCEGCHLCSAGRGCKTRLQLYCFKGFPLISMCKVMTKRAQSDTLWPKSLGREGAKSTFCSCRTFKDGNTHKKRPFVTKKRYISLQDTLWNPKNKSNCWDFLALLCLYEKNWTCSVTHLSQEELFLPILVVYVGFKGSKIMWDCRRGELFKRHEIPLDGLKSSLFTAHNGGRGGQGYCQSSTSTQSESSGLLSNYPRNTEKRTLPHKKGWDTSPSVQTMH